MQNAYTVPATFTNLVLRALEPESITRLALHRVALELRREIEHPGQPIAHVFFVEGGMASMTTTFEDGAQVEVGMFGYESVIGVSALMGTKQSLNRVYMQIAGFGYSARLQAAQREFDLGGRFHRLALRYVQTQLVQAMQSAGCNIKHPVNQRLARWLLLCSDRVHSPDFRMSHEFLADMLGSSRPSVSIAADSLKDEKLIEYHRGQIRILDRPGLERRACECYSVIKNHLASFAEFEGGVEEKEATGVRRAV